MSVSIEDAIYYLKHNAHCSYEGDCTAPCSRCKNCGDYVLEYNEEILSFIINKLKKKA